MVGWTLHSQRRSKLAWSHRSRLDTDTSQSYLLSLACDVQLIIRVFVFLAPLMAGAGLVAVLLLWLAAILTVITGAQYFMFAWPVLKNDA